MEKANLESAWMEYAEKHGWDELAKEAATLLICLVKANKTQANFNVSDGSMVAVKTGKAPVLSLVD